MSNVARQMEWKLRPEQLGVLRKASKASMERGVEVFLVGGTVRDILLSNRPADLDLVVVASRDVADSLVHGFGGEVVARSEFGTWKLEIDGIDIDIAFARRESYGHPGALPDVTSGTPREDLVRRDFSINAMAVSLAEETWGDLLDPFNGQRDLEDGLIRVLHPQSFVDDPTRILRAVRYVHRLGFRIGGETGRLLKRDLGKLSVVSGDRIRHELERFFHEDRVAEMLRGAQDLGVLPAIHPALRIDSTVLDKLSAMSPDRTPEGDMRLLAMLVFAVPKEDISPLIGRLNMDGRWAKVVRDVAAVRDSFDKLEGESISRSRVFALLRHLDPASVAGCALATDQPLVEQRLELYLTELRPVRPLLNGNGLIALGVPEGPEVGRLLEVILMARLDGLLSTREDEENLVVRSMERGGEVSSGSSTTRGLFPTCRDSAPQKDS